MPSALAPVRAALGRGASCTLVATLAAGVLLPGAVAHAQQAPPAAASVASPGAVHGTVFDSTAGAPLVDAVVQLVTQHGGPERVVSLRTDAAGRFHADGLAPGTWAIGFIHPALDLFGLELPTGAVQVRAGDTTRVMLGLPGMRALHGVLCEKPTKASKPATDDLGGMVGVVHDADDAAPVAGARVAIVWSTLDVARGVRLVPQRLVATTEASGIFRVCGLPADVPLVVRVEAGTGGDTTRTSGEVAVTVPPGAFVRTELAIGRAVTVAAPATAGASADSAGSVAEVVLTGSARLSGTVRDEQGQPVARARVLLRDAGHEAVTDSGGAFELSGLPSGSRTVEVRALGFAPARLPVTLSRERPARVTFGLSTPVWTLAGVTVTARAAFRERFLNDLRTRTHAGGRLITDEDLLRERPIALSDALRAQMGFRVVPVGNGRQGLRGRQNCVPRVYLDGMPMQGGADEIDFLVHPSAVLAVEIYPSLGTIPLQYGQGGNRCGVVAVWTRH
jgi:protocatechuate 3,4-dioxygenase beta subunit